jgi:ankyrin repeat protein
VKSGADIEITDKNGQTCLFYAIRDNHYQIVEYILDKVEYTKINETDNNDFTLYEYALKLSRKEIADFLLSKGATKRQKSENKKQKKSKKKNAANNNIGSSINNDKLLKCLLVRISSTGEKIPMTCDEIEQFKADYPDLYEIIQSNSK